jgi:NADPH2:quinone reductase
MKAIQIEQFGGPEVLQLREIPAKDPGKGEVRIRLEAIGVNFIDVYHRTGLYPVPLPFTPGTEGAGVVDAVGPEVDNVQPGQRVAWAMTPGSYAEWAVIPAWRAALLPDSIRCQDAAAAMLQGMTAHYLVRGTYPVQAGDTVLVHAAAGGTGLLLVQAAKHLGARVIGTVSNQEKARLVKEAGADETILYTEKDFLEETRRITEGRGVDVVYDSVGQSTFERSMGCLRPRGMLVLFGQSSGPVPPLDPNVLSRKGSLFLTRPSLATYTSTPEELAERTAELLHWIAVGAVKLRIDSTFPLADAAEAHRRLQSRASSGKILLLP